jgi:hypothetical protein
MTSPDRSGITVSTTSYTTQRDTIFDEPKGGITAVPAKVLVDGSSRIRNPAKQSALS